MWGKKMITNILPYFQLAATCGTLIAMIYALSKFVKRPQEDLEDRVTKLEVKQEEIEDSLKMGNDKFRELKNASTLIVTSIIALIEFEMDYCMHHGDEKISDDLKKAKDNLYSFLAEK